MAFYLDKFGIVDIVRVTSLAVSCIQQGVDLTESLRYAVEEIYAKPMLDLQTREVIFISFGYLSFTQCFDTLFVAPTVCNHESNCQLRSSSIRSRHSLLQSHTKSSLARPTPLGR